MATVEKAATQNHNMSEHIVSLWDTVDHRVDGLLFMSTAKYMLMMNIIYFGVVNIGPKLMVDRKPYKLTALMIIYNLLIAIANLYAWIEFMASFINRNSIWQCQVRPPMTVDVEAARVISAMHFFLLTKPVEMIDTVFFILRKKENQLSFLHIYHHSATITFGWCITRWIPTEPTVYIGCLFNASIHVIMYSYYALAALGPAVQKYLWWKKYITVFQMVQFVVVLIIEIALIVTGCSSATWIHCLFASYGVSLICLFSKFYQKAYRHKQS
ncbi:hypothetical protein CHUAL_001929 [Chamberlinius hualienensis]